MEHFDPGKQADGRPARRRQHKPELPVPKVSYAEFAEAQADDKVKKALRNADREAESLEQEGKIHA